MSDGQVKKNTVQGYISLNGQRYLATGQVNILRFFLPLISDNWVAIHLTDMIICCQNFFASI